MSIYLITAAFTGEREASFNVGKVLPEALHKIGGVFKGLPSPVVPVKHLTKEYFNKFMAAEVQIVTNKSGTAPQKRGQTTTTTCAQPGPTSERSLPESVVPDASPDQQDVPLPDTQLMATKLAVQHQTPHLLCADVVSDVAQLGATPCTVGLHDNPSSIACAHEINIVGLDGVVLGTAVKTPEINQCKKLKQRNIQDFLE